MFSSRSSVRPWRRDRADERDQLAHRADLPTTSPRLEVTADQVLVVAVAAAPLHVKSWPTNHRLGRVNASRPPLHRGRIASASERCASPRAPIKPEMPSTWSRLQNWTLGGGGAAPGTAMSQLLAVVSRSSSVRTNRCRPTRQSGAVPHRLGTLTVSNPFCDHLQSAVRHGDHVDDIRGVDLPMSGSHGQPSPSTGSEASRTSYSGWFDDASIGTLGWCRASSPISAKK